MKVYFKIVGSALLILSLEKAYASPSYETEISVLEERYSFRKESAKTFAVFKEPLIIKDYCNEQDLLDIRHSLSTSGKLPILSQMIEETSEEFSKGMYLLNTILGIISAQEEITEHVLEITEKKEENTRKANNEAWGYYFSNKDLIRSSFAQALTEAVEKLYNVFSDPMLPALKTELSTLDAWEAILKAYGDKGKSTELN